MPTPALMKYGFYAVHDSGAPPNHHDYTTLIVFHGMGFHSAIFDKLFPLLSKLNINIRLVAANRPDYPGATPLADKERMQLDEIARAVDQKSAANTFLDYTKATAKKTHDFLAEFISRESIPVEGGIVVAGWSLGAATILGLLANAHTFSTKEFDLHPYVRHAVLYDTPSFLLGYAPPPSVLNIFFDPALMPGEALKLFPQWVSGYYAHGEDLTKLEYQALSHPPPTILSMDPSDVQRCLEISPVLPGGSDDQFVRLGYQSGAFSQLKDAAFYIDIGNERDSRIENKWDSVGIKHIWCDQSMWEMPWAALQVQADLKTARKSGKVTRKVEMVRLRGANHFCHWDQPELSLKGLLTGLDL